MNPKTALVTGAAKRVGAVIAKQLHADGYNIVVHYQHSKEAANNLVAELNALRSNSAKSLSADLGNTEEITKLAERVSAEGLDLLVNNASSFYPTPIGGVSESDWDQLINSNVKGAFFLSQALAPVLKEHNGAIINIVDIHSEKPMSQYPVYSMAKAALAMMTKSLAKELAPDIRVNGVSPGAILWPEEELEEDQKKVILDRIPLQRTGQPEDIASTVLFLAKAPYITGQIISVDGGRTLNQ